MRRIDFQKDTLLYLLIITDLAFVILHLLYRYTGTISSGLYSLSRDRGYAEFFQYTKELWVTALLLAIALKRRKALFAVLALVFFFLLVDDAFQFHEGVGQLLAGLFNLPAGLGLESKDIGELVVFAVGSVLIALAVAIFYFLADSGTRATTRYLIGLLLFFGAFGVVVDLIHSMITYIHLARVVTIIEETGEMLVMSVITWYVFRLNAAQPQTADTGASG